MNEIQQQLNSVLAKLDTLIEIQNKLLNTPNQDLLLEKSLPTAWNDMTYSSDVLKTEHGSGTHIATLPTATSSEYLNVRGKLSTSVTDPNFTNNDTSITYNDYNLPTQYIVEKDMLYAG